MVSALDVLGLGCVAIDDLLYVPAYPAADAKVQVRRRERHCGGLTATAVVAAARLGARSAFAGVLGEDELSQFVLERFHQEGIDTTWVRRRSEARPIHSTIIVDETQKTRTIFYDLEGAFGAEPDWPDSAVIRAAKVLFVDHFGMEGMIRAAALARAEGIPIVADLESDAHPRFPELLALIDHLVLSRDFAQKVTGRTDPAAIVRHFWTPRRQAVVITCGAEGCWYISGALGEAPRFQPAFRVEAVDTTGCGDVFHGAYAAALASGMEMPARVQFASAAAALKATQCGGQAGIPTRATVEAFLRERGYQR